MKLPQRQIHPVLHTIFLALALALAAALMRTAEGDTALFAKTHDIALVRHAGFCQLANILVALLTVPLLTIFLVPREGAGAGLKTLRRVLLALLLGDALMVGVALTALVLQFTLGSGP
jgi:hypothetical protein